MLLCMDEEFILTKKEIEKHVLDGMVLWAGENDEEIDSAIKWIDEQAQEKGISFYEMVDKLEDDHDVESRARKWLAEK